MKHATLRDRQTRTAGASWPTLRKRALHRDHHTCPCGQPATAVDHITPLRDGGINMLDNLQSLCDQCHAAKTTAARRAA
jgi:5-methylcytosine-specific restriction protein A